MLILPEVLDPKVWDGGDLFYYHAEDKVWVDMLRVAARTVMYNTTLVKESDLSSYKDLAVARGKYSILLGGSSQYQAEFLAVGAPLAIKIPKEGDYATTSFGAVYIPTRLAHPNAATIFVNWLLTRDGQSLFAKGAGGPSRRLDASTEGVDPLFIPQPGEKLNWQSPEFSLRGGKVLEAATKMLAEVGK